MDYSDACEILDASLKEAFDEAISNGLTLDDIGQAYALAYEVHRHELEGKINAA